MNNKADEVGFVAVYPNGTGLANLMLSWNSDGFRGKMAEGRVDDVAFIGRLLDDLGPVASNRPNDALSPSPVDPLGVNAGTPGLVRHRTRQSPRCRESPLFGR